MIITIAVIVVVAWMLIAFVAKSVKLVPQAHNWILERFGKYIETLKPGLNLINPFFSRIACQIDIREQVLDMPSQPIITADNATVSVNGVVFYKIMDPYKAFYGITNLNMAISNLAKTSLRAIMGKMTLDESLSNRDAINNELLVLLDEATDAWGTKITRVEIQDIVPPHDIADAMAKQMKAERNKRAQILEAEGKRQAEIEKAQGEKQGAILAAEGKRQAAELEAEARERLANAEAAALKVVSNSLKESGGDPTSYLLGQAYIKQFGNMAQSSNSKFVVLPTELLKSIEGLFKR